MSDTAQVEAPPAENTNGTAPAPETPAAEAKRQVAGLYISTPDVLRDRIEAEATKVGKTSRVFVRDFLAQQWGLVLPEPRTRSVYKSDEERKAATDAKRKARADLIKQLLAEHKQKQLAMQSA